MLTASGRDALVEERGHLLRNDPRYAFEAQRVGELARDLVELLAHEPLDRLQAELPAKLLANGQNSRNGKSRFTAHARCNMRRNLGGVVELILQRPGFDRIAVPAAHLCCESAGTYSITQPEFAKR